MTIETEDDIAQPIKNEPTPIRLSKLFLTTIFITFSALFGLFMLVFAHYYLFQAITVEKLACNYAKLYISSEEEQDYRSRLNRGMSGLEIDWGTAITDIHIDGYEAFVTTDTNAGLYFHVKFYTPNYLPFARERESRVFHVLPRETPYWTSLLQRPKNPCD